MISYHTLLTHLGLSDKESAIYLALLELGPSDVTEIAIKANIKRPTAYVVLDTLVEKGFICTVAHTVRHYQAEDPKKLLAVQQAKLLQFESAIPGLIGLASTSEQKPTARFFNGIEGIKAVYEESLLQPAGSEIMAIGHAQAVEDGIAGFADWYIKRRVSGNISMRAITNSEPGSLAVVQRDHDELRHTRVLPKDKLDEQFEINIYGNKVTAVSFVHHELIGIIIESSVFAAAHRQMFEILWKVAEDLPKKSK
jgi:sugar-specific transcriptional regulator TrmB